MCTCITRRYCGVSITLCACAYRAIKINASRPASWQAMTSLASPRNSSYKVTLVGSPFVGKTALFLRLARGEFVETTTTSGLDYTTKHFEVDGQTITVN